MLLFEFFPLFVAIVGLLAAIVLYVRDRRARADPAYHEERPTRPNRAPSSSTGRTHRRPSMMP